MISYKGLVEYLLLQRMCGKRGPFYVAVSPLPGETEGPWQCGHKHTSAHAAVGCFLRLLSKSKRRSRRVVVQLHDVFDGTYAAVSTDGRWRF